MLEAYVELDRSREELTTDGFDPDVVERALAHDRPRRVQAAPGAARCEAPPEGVRPRPAHADHEPLARLARGACEAPRPNTTHGAPRRGNSAFAGDVDGRTKSRVAPSARSLQPELAARDADAPW